ncbi:class D sortase [Paenibacillus oryzisoli]|uniref:Sortase n=1 Tax=Paenibacillus oryzisoli TaxID=1850517 RepID=A0A198AE79_9BACL|nr:class D sortase [Paenibacillus oryzisoli]OAS19492.1 sortase [Paenibacillus oryzisoli]
MSRRWFALLLILLGVGVFLYPTMNDRYESYQQQQILQQWQDNMQAMGQLMEEEGEDPHSEGVLNAAPVGSVVTPLSEASASTAVAGQLESVVAKPTSGSKAPVNVIATAKPPPAKPKNMEGVLSIDKIDLKLPILTGATMDNMKVAVASIANTGKAGAIGNYAIAGHRNLTYGKNFNRLDEVVPGDEIEVETGSRKFVYRVEEKLYVLPSDVWVLQSTEGNREITLITCDPMVDPTHRLIVKGKLIE